MVLVDANVLLNAVNSDAAQHEPARRWLERALTGTEAVGLAWVVLLAFVRVGTRSGLLPSPMSVAEAFDHVQSWLDQPVATVVHPTHRHVAVLRGLLEQVGTGGNLTSDAHLAALAVEHGADVCTFDGDFSRFPGVRRREPT